jgi:hypothetical protein
MAMQNTDWGPSDTYHRAQDRWLNGYRLILERSAVEDAWVYIVKRGSNVQASGRNHDEAAARAEAERLAAGRVLRIGNWTAHWCAASPGGVNLDYEGKVFKRSQRLVRYDWGGLGYDFPEEVPRGVRDRIEAWAEKLPCR